MKKTDVIIIGAGAAGLMAAHTLAKAGKAVTVLEARDRIGGRIHTLNNSLFSTPVEMGAEFVHGNLPVTLSLLKKAGISTFDVAFEMWQYRNGKFEESEAFVEGWDGFLKELNKLEEDMPLYDFLEYNFAGEKHAAMRAQIESYVSGYDTADFRDASAFALRNEWNHEDEDAQYRVDGGYGTLMQYLADVCLDAGNEIMLNTIVTKVLWKNNTVKVVTASGTIYESEKVIIALPLGVLQATEETEGAIIFNPPLPKQTEAIHNIGFGSVIKILLEFEDIFWERDAVTDLAQADLSTMGFLFSDEAIPTFWTQAPERSPLLTGWLGGPPADEKKDVPDDEILHQALVSLGNIFKITPAALKDKLAA